MMIRGSGDHADPETKHNEHGLGVNDPPGETVSTVMSSREKAQAIRPWIDPDERIRVDFEDAVNVNAVVLACTDETVELELETSFPHHRQRGTVPLRLVDVGEDRSRYTRNPDKPLRYGVLWLGIRQPREKLMADNP